MVVAGIELGLWLWLWGWLFNDLLIEAAVIVVVAISGKPPVLRWVLVGITAIVIVLGASASAVVVGVANSPFNGRLEVSTLLSVLQES